MIDDKGQIHRHPSSTRQSSQGSSPQGRRSGGGKWIVAMAIAIGLILYFAGSRNKDNPSTTGEADISRLKNASRPTVRPQGGPTWKTYYNSNFGFSMDYPDGWTVSEKQKENIFRTRFKLPSSYVSIMLDVGIRVPERSPIDWWQEFDRRLKRAYGDRYQLISIKESTLGGKNAAAWIFTLEREAEPNLKKLDIGAFHNGNSYALLFAAPKADFGSWQTTSDHIAKSFRFTGSQVTETPRSTR